MTEKRQISQGYIIRILQHFATKLWNITNFVMLFQAVMKFLSITNFSYKGKGPLFDLLAFVAQNVEISNSNDQQKHSAWSGFFSPRILSSEHEVSKVVVMVTR